MWNNVLYLHLKMLVQYLGSTWQVRHLEWDNTFLIIPPEGSKPHLVMHSIKVSPSQKYKNKPKYHK